MKKIKRYKKIIQLSAVIILQLLIIYPFSGFTQVGINPTNSDPNASAGVDVDFSTAGLLIPRIALTGTASPSPLPAHVAGLMVYNTASTGDVLPGYYFNDGTKWTNSQFSGEEAGNLFYWDGNRWAMVSPGYPGQKLMFTSFNIPVWSGAGFATLVTSAVANVTTSTADCGGSIIIDGGFPVTARGVCYDTLPNPTTTLTTTTLDGSGTGTFTSSLTGLVSGKLYYIRAYSTNATGTSYGNQRRFRTN